MRDVVIIGSGFGASVLAARLGPRANVLLLEKGDDPTGDLDPKSNGAPLNAQKNRFRQSLAPENAAAFAELYSDRSTMSVIAGKGFGGGSNIYDGVSLRAPTESFEQKVADRRLWPAYYTRASLAPFYAKAEARLGVQRVAWTGGDRTMLATKRDYVFAEGCRRIGHAAAPLKLADANDANDGWWNQGQRFSGRQSLFMNYLQDAKKAGVELWSGCEVTRIEKLANSYAVHGIDRRGAESTFAIETKLVVLGAGAIASSALLMKSAIDGVDPQGVLGKYVSSNGDYGVTGIVGEDFDREVQGFKGKPMSSFCPTFWKQHQFILIPFYAQPLFLALHQPTTILRPKNPDALGRNATTTDERDFGTAYQTRMKSFGSRMLTMGCLALDACEGEIRLKNDRAEVVWASTDPATETRWRAATDAMQKIYRALGGEMYLDGYRREGTVSTAHPLGGCRMAEKGGPGVVDPCGEATRNLFVVDASIIPSALGVNPSLTIAAVAESIADRLLRGDGTSSLADRLS